MIIVIGSKNDVKTKAVKDALLDLGAYRDSVLYPVDVPSEVEDQPITIERISLGAYNRARNSYHAPNIHKPSDYGVGIEDGLHVVGLNGNSENFLISACVIYDGSHSFIGLSSAVPMDHRLAELVKYHNMDFNQAAVAMGLTNDKSIGRTDGLVYLLTKHTDNPLRRPEHMKQGVLSALKAMSDGRTYLP